MEQICNKKDLLLQHLDNTISAEELTQFKEHLIKCNECQQELENFKLFSKIMDKQQIFTTYTKPHFLKEYFSSYIDNTLTTKERTKLQKHLVNCLQCRNELISLNNLLLSATSLEQTPVLLKQKALNLDTQSKPQLPQTFFLKLFIKPFNLKIATALTFAVLIFFIIYHWQKQINTPIGNQIITKKNLDNKKINSNIKESPKKLAVKPKKISQKNDRQIVLKNKSPKSKILTKKQTTNKNIALNNKKETSQQIKTLKQTPTGEKQTLAQIPLEKLDKETLKILSDEIKKDKKQDLDIISKALKDQGINIPVYGIKKLELTKEVKEKIKIKDLRKLILKLNNSGTLKILKENKEKTNNEE